MTTRTNPLATYHDAMAGLTAEQRRNFDSFFLGWVIDSIPADTLTNALIASRRFVTSADA